WCVARLTLAWKAARRLRRSCRAIDDEQFWADVEMVRQRIGLRSSPMIFSSGVVRCPLVFGPWKALVVIPEHLLAGSRQQLRVALAHEMAHLARRDLAWNMLAAL